MDTRSRILFAMLLTAIIISIAFIYYRTMIAKDYEVVETSTEGIQE